MKNLLVICLFFLLPQTLKKALDEGKYFISDECIGAFCIGDDLNLLEGNPNIVKVTKEFQYSMSSITVDMDYYYYLEGEDTLYYTRKLKQDFDNGDTKISLIIAMSPKMKTSDGVYLGMGINELKRIHPEVSTHFTDGFYGNQHQLFSFSTPAEGREVLFIIEYGIEYHNDNKTDTTVIDIISTYAD